MFLNRTTNAVGGAEKRRGIARLAAAIPGGPTLTGLHELVDAQTGATTMFASGDGKIYREEVTASAWVTAHDSGWRDVTYQSVQMVDRLIFVNGTSRPVFSKDGVTFEELRAIVTDGTMTGDTSANGFFDTSHVDFFDEGVAVNDIVWNRTRNLFGWVNSVATAAVTHTIVGGQTAGDRYQIINTIELNVFPRADDDPDNLAIAGPGTGTFDVYVSGMSWPGTAVRIGDWILNPDRVSLSQVSSIGVSALGLSGGGIPGQVAGDSLIFVKSAMPIPERAHVHYGRLYMIDSRDRHVIRISGPDDPTDMTSSSTDIDTRIFSFGGQQPTGDTIQTMVSFQRFLVMAGRRFTLLFEGTDPTTNAAGIPNDFRPIGLFPQGVRSPNGMVITGNDALMVSDSGVLAFSLSQDSSITQQQNISEQIKNTLFDMIAQTATDDIYAWHYPRRSLIGFKIGSEIYVFNYVATEALGPAIAFDPRFPSRGSWSKFDGKFAQQKVFMVRQDGTLICAGADGLVYQFDTDTYTDDGDIYRTVYQAGWLTFDEPRRGPQIKQLQYIQPSFDTSAGVVYTITAEAPFGQTESTDRIVVGADGKYSLRVRGKEIRLTFETEDGLGPDVLSRYTLFYNRFGVR